MQKNFKLPISIIAIFALVVAITSSGCDSCGGFGRRGAVPDAPYGVADDTLKVHSKDYISVEYVFECVDGEKIGCFGLTEPNFGSNPGGMATRCKRDGDDWIINGNKMWITNGTLAHVAVVWARDEEGIVRGFLLEKGMDGFTSSDIHGKLSLRASVTSELSMTNVRVPDSASLPKLKG